MPAKKDAARLKKVEEFNAEEQKAWEAKTEPERRLYLARLGAQEAEDAIAAAHKEEEDARAAAKRSRYMVAGEKKITAAVRSGELTLETAPAAIATLVITGTGAVAFNVKPPTEIREHLNPTEAEVKDMLPRIEEAAKKPAPAASSSGKATPIPAPTWKLTHRLETLSREAFVNAGGATPDATLTSLMRRYPLIEPIIATPDFSGEEGKLRIMRGKRRLSLIPEAEGVPTVIVSGFPDEYTLEAATAALSRGRSLNVFAAGEFIARARTRGKDDATIRRDVGYKTGEVDKYAEAVKLPTALLEGVKDGRITSATALLIAKQPAHIREALAADFTERRGKETESAPARVTEADVDSARQKLAAEAVKRDAPTLAGLAGGVNAGDVTGGGSTSREGEGAAQVSSESAKKGGAAQTADGGAPGASSPVSAAATGAKDKELDKGAGGAVESASGADGADWIEGALEALGETLEAIPVDAPNPVLPAYRALREKLIEAGGDAEFAVTPDVNPPETFKAPRKAAVANRVEARSGWKASALPRLKTLLERIDGGATPVLEAYHTLKDAVSSAKVGAREELD